MQNFHPGDLVRIKEDIGPIKAPSICNCEAVVLFSYFEKYGGDEKDKTKYTLFISSKGEVSWYNDWDLVLIERNWVKDHDLGKSLPRDELFFEFENYYRSSQIRNPGMSKIFARQYGPDLTKKEIPFVDKGQIAPRAKGATYLFNRELLDYADLISPKTVLNKKFYEQNITDIECSIDTKLWNTFEEYFLIPKRMITQYLLVMPYLSTKILPASVDGKEKAEDVQGAILVISSGNTNYPNTLGQFEWMRDGNTKEEWFGYVQKFIPSHIDEDSDDSVEWEPITEHNKLDWIYKSEQSGCWHFINTATADQYTLRGIEVVNIHTDEGKLIISSGRAGYPEKGEK